MISVQHEAPQTQFLQCLWALLTTERETPSSLAIFLVTDKYPGTCQHILKQDATKQSTQHFMRKSFGPTKVGMSVACRGTGTALHCQAQKDLPQIP